MSLIIVSITITYLFLIGSFIYGFDKLKSFKLDDTEAITTFSVIIPYKNEAKNLPILLESISQLNYPRHLFEVLLVNDDSDDGSESIIKKHISKRPFVESKVQINSIHNNRQTKSPKKDAINTAIDQAKFDWIVTTDADCVVPKFWLDSFDGFIQNNETNFIAAPVRYHNIDTFLKRFQTLDFLSLIGTTIGSFGIGKSFLCNGANLAYKKHFFYTVNGFQGNTDIASGDDIFLLEKAFKHEPGKVNYLKSELAVVKTQPQPDFKSLLSQRIRWAAKASHYNNLFGKFTGLLVFIMNTTLIGCVFLTLIGGLTAKFLAYIFILKFSIDFLLIFKTARFFNQEEYLSSYLFSSFLYPLFSVYVALISNFKGYQWKGNQYKK